MRRDLHAERVEGVNARFRAAEADRNPAPAHHRGIVASSPIADRLRYGECSGFGAPQARAFRESTIRR